MTMKELAKLANVSVSAVSKAFCEAEDISEETKQHIFNIAKQYGCFGKYYKGKFHKKIIAIICPEINSSFYSVFTQELQHLIEENNGICIISSCDFDAKKQAELIEYYASYLNIDGLFVISMRSKIKKGYSIPIVSLLSNENGPIDSVDIDINSPFFEAIDKLIALGHKKIAFFSEKLTTKKEELFKKYLLKKQECEGITYQSEHRFEEAGRDSAKQLLLEHKDVTAVICAYDNIAIGAISEFKKQGLNIPNDISVIGIDNISTGKYAETALTTIDSNPKDVCRIAWDLLEKKLKNPYFKSFQNITIKSNLIVRESISKAKKLY